MSCKLAIENRTKTATLSSNQVKAGYSLNSLKNDFKTSVCVFNLDGGLGGYCDITFQWSEQQVIGCILIPSSSLSSGASMEIINVQGKGDYPSKYIFSGTTLQNWDFSQNLNSTQGLEQCLGLLNSKVLRDTPPVGVWYFPKNIITSSLTVRIRDDNADTVAISSLVISSVINFEINASYDSVCSYEDSTQHQRAASGDLRSSRGLKSKTMQIDASWVTEADKEKVLEMFSKGSGEYVFISLLPEHEDPSLERQYSIYGKLENLGSFSLSEYGIQNTNYKIIGY